jgi:hypothetical protein
MSKTSFTALIILLLALCGVGYWYFFVRTSPNDLPGAVITEDSGLFPFSQNGQSSNKGGTASTGGSTSTSTGTTTIDLSGDIAAAYIPRLRQITTVPTAGAVTFTQKGTALVRTIERATGHIFETRATSTLVTKISNVTIPKLHDAIWSVEGDRFLARYLREDGDTIRTFSAKIATTTRPEQALEGKFLEDGIRDVIAVGSKMFYFMSNPSGSQAYSANFDGSSKSAVYTSTYSDWALLPGGKTLVTIFSRPSGASSGAAYILNTASGSYSLIANDVNGLVALANTDGTRAIASGISGRSLATVAFDLKKGTNTPLGITTIVDKCVWSDKSKNIVFCSAPQLLPSGVYPDDWYKGKVSFDDSLWKIDLSSGETSNIMTPELEAGVSMDMFKLTLDASEKFLTFTNKKDMTVWLYRLGE